jgi:predicted dehydrogenase
VKPLRFGVVGCGAISTVFQLPALRRCQRAEVVAVSDVDGKWAERVAHRFGVPEAYADYRRLVGRVDAALVATTHADIACTLLEAGVHVLCEKPMATTRADVDRMLDVARRSGSRLMAGHCLRFSPNFAMLHRAVAAGWIGRPTAMRAAIGSPYEAGAQRTDFRRRRGLAGGGVLIDLGIHVIDLAVWVAGGALASVACDTAATTGWEVETDGEVVLEFAGGSQAILAASYRRAMENTFTVRGTDGWASASLYVPTRLDLFGRHARLCRRGGVQQLLLPDESMYDRQLEHFCAAVRSQTEFLIQPDEVRAAIGVVEQCYALRGAA